MDAETKTLRRVLRGDRRFLIPVYQRPYVWERERQWEPLWSDVESTALRLGETRRAAYEKGEKPAAADKTASPHFLGAVVLEQLPTRTGDIEVRSVVDGQQRLITLQLLLLGTIDALEAAGISKREVVKLRKLTRNDEEVESGEAVHKL